MLSNGEPEMKTLLEMLHGHVMVRQVSKIVEMQRLLGSGDVDMVFCPWSFAGGDWNSVIAGIRRICPELPVIVTSRVGAEKEWLSVLEAGGFDLLTPPYRTSIVLALVEQAVASQEAREWSRRSILAREA
jgi:DNA-binding NtrC family response regulator